MVASNELDCPLFEETAEILFKLIVEISQKLKIKFEFVNIGGGVGIPYRPEQKRIDLKEMSRASRKKYDKSLSPRPAPIKLFTECGRYITGPYGYLFRVLHIKNTYKNLPDWMPAWPI